VDLSPGRLGREYVYEAIERKIIFFDSARLPQRRFLGHLLDVSIDRAYAKLRFDRIDEAHVREKMVKALFDILCLQIANRIAEIETGGKTDDLNEFTGKFSNEPRLDPFTSEALLWDTSAETFYSVGPDEMDDGNLLRYNPTNGIISVGDISLR